MGLADHEIGHLLICLYFIQVFADQLVAALLLIDKVQPATRNPHFLAQNPLQAVAVLHEHLLVMRLALDGIPRADAACHLLEDLELHPQLGVLHDEIVGLEEGNVL